MTRIETALRQMLAPIEYIDDMSDPLRVEGRMLATPTGQALSALVEAAEAWAHSETDELDLPLARAVRVFRAATEPQP